MTKPNFKEMSRAELKTYVTAYRDDDEAWDAFFEKLEQERSPDTKWYPASTNAYRVLGKRSSTFLKSPAAIISKNVSLYLNAARRLPL